MVSVNSMLERERKAIEEYEKASTHKQGKIIRETIKFIYEKFEAAKRHFLKYKIK